MFVSLISQEATGTLVQVNVPECFFCSSSASVIIHQYISEHSVKYWLWIGVRNKLDSVKQSNGLSIRTMHTHRGSDSFSFMLSSHQNQNQSSTESICRIREAFTGWCQLRCGSFS